MRYLLLDEGALDESEALTLRNLAGALFRFKGEETIRIRGRREPVRARLRFVRRGEAWCPIVSDLIDTGSERPLSLRWTGLETTRENMIRLGCELRALHGPAVLAERVEKLLPRGRNCVIDSIRHPAFRSRRTGRPRSDMLPMASTRSGSRWWRSVVSFRRERIRSTISACSDVVWSA